MKVSYTVSGDDYIQAGKASAELKRLLGRLGVDPSVIKRSVVAMYEGEMNMAIHAHGGVAEIEIVPELVTIVLRDSGPGIPDLGLAMTEGYSTASEQIREMGFGAGMGMPNMERNSDTMRVDTALGEGTCVTMTFRIPAGGG